MNPRLSGSKWSLCFWMSLLCLFIGTNSAPNFHDLTKSSLNVHLHSFQYKSNMMLDGTPCNPKNHEVPCSPAFEVHLKPTHLINGIQSYKFGGYDSEYRNNVNITFGSMTLRFYDIDLNLPWSLVIVVTNNDFNRRNLLNEFTLPITTEILLAALSEPKRITVSNERTQIDVSLELLLKTNQDEKIKRIINQAIQRVLQADLVSYSRENRRSTSISPAPDSSESSSESVTVTESSTEATSKTGPSSFTSETSTVTQSATETTSKTGPSISTSEKSTVTESSTQSILTTSAIASTTPSMQLSSGAIAGISIAVIAVSVGGAVGGYFIWRHFRS